MPKLRIVYIVSIVLLGVVLTLTVFRPMILGGEYTEVSRESVIQLDDKWIIEFHIINKEGKDTAYFIIWSTGEESYTARVLVPDGRIYTHGRHIYPDTMKNGKVDLAIYKEGEPTPIEQTTYYIDFD